MNNQCIPPVFELQEIKGYFTYIEVEAMKNVSGARVLNEIDCNKFSEPNGLVYFHCFLPLTMNHKTLH